MFGFSVPADLDFCDVLRRPSFEIVWRLVSQVCFGRFLFEYVFLISGLSAAQVRFAFLGRVEKSTVSPWGAGP
jgi:hypothetical protein